jgi:hypothetical protein
MRYPPDFPAELCERLAVTIAKFEAEFSFRRDAIPAPSWLLLHLLFLRDRRHPALEELIKRFSLEVFDAFARELCELGRRSNWTAAQVREHADDFLRELLCEAQDKHRDEQGIAYRVRDGGPYGFHGELRAHVVRSIGWRQFLTDIGGMAENQLATRSLPIATKRENSLEAVPDGDDRVRNAQSSNEKCSEPISDLERISGDGLRTQSTLAERRNAIYPRQSGWDEEMHATVGDYLLECKEAKVGIPNLTEIRRLAKIDKAEYSRLMNGGKLTKRGAHSKPYKRLKHLCTTEKPHLKSVTNRGGNQMPQ